MALVHNNNLGIYAGVSRQALDLRPSEACEEMLNCFPSIPYGVQRRNPTQQISTSVLAADNQFAHSYDRGLSGESTEQYLITIDKVNGLRVLDVNAGVYRTVTYSGAAATYLESSNPEVGFSAITIKDTTFIANRDIIPATTGELTLDINKKTIKFIDVGYSSLYEDCYRQDSFLGPRFAKIYTNLAPARLKTWSQLSNDYKTWYSESAAGATLTITIDGVAYTYVTQVRSDGFNLMPETMNEYRINIYAMLSSALNSSLYRVVIAPNNSIDVYKLNGTAITVTWGLSFPSEVSYSPEGVTKIPAFSHPVVGTYTIGAPTVIESALNTFGTSKISNVSDHDKMAFVWVKQASVDAAFPYSYTVSLFDTAGALLGTTTTSSANTQAVATAIATWANTVTGFYGVANGTVCKIGKSDFSAFRITVSDSYGSQAMGAWIGTVTTMNDLPKHFPFKDTVVKIDGVQRDDDVAYWVKYDGNSWVEWRDPTMDNVITDSTMPHKLVRNADFTFTFSEQTYSDVLVGDTKTNPRPEFIGSPIKDLFFINGRLGFLTKNGISLSQQGVFENFFRTTILALLDDSAITTYIDSSKSVGLEYATELQGNIILFGDKLQFALDGNKALSPSTISIQPVSGFEINTNVKPLSVGDSVFFLVSKNGYSSLMEMNKSSISLNIRAFDVSAHVPNYISGDIMQICASTRDNVVFLRSRINKDTIYVYNHFGTETERSQMAWSKWVFDMDIKSIFIFDKDLYLFGNRYNATVPLDEFSLVGTWMDTKTWLDETYWVDGDILATPSFEKMEITPNAVGATFKDIGTVTYRSEIELSEWALTNSATKQKELRGNLLIKTIEISSEDNSNFSLIVEDKERETSRLIPSRYTVNRKPFISGNAKNMRIKLRSVNGDGFRISAISLEGQYNVRSKRV